MSIETMQPLYVAEESIAESIDNLLRYTKPVPPPRPLDKVIELVDTDFYDHFSIPKRGKKGKCRHIIALKGSVQGTSMKKAHKAISSFLYRTLPVHSSVFSYKKGLSISDCAEHHTGKRTIVGIDFKDYFYSIRFDVLYAFLHEVLPNHKATDAVRKSLKTDLTMDEFIALICRILTTFSPIDNTTLVLPIGTTPSPIIANSILYHLDEELDDYTKSQGITYTRYCDNIFLSSHNRIENYVIEDVVSKINGFTRYGKFLEVNYDKTRVLPYYRRQRILGVVVNKHTNIPVERQKWMRSAIAHLMKDLRSSNTLTPKLDHRYRKIMGELSFLSMVNKEKADKYNLQKLALQVARLAISNERKKVEGQR